MDELLGEYMNELATSPTCFLQPNQANILCLRRTTYIMYMEINYLQKCPTHNNLGDPPLLPELTRLRENKYLLLPNYTHSPGNQIGRF